MFEMNFEEIARRDAQANRSRKALSPCAVHIVDPPAAQQDKDADRDRRDAITIAVASRR